MLGGGVDATTLVAALGAGPPPPECRWGRRPHRGATACRLLERDDRGVDGPGVEGDGRLGELLEVERDTSFPNKYRRLRQLCKQVKKSISNCTPLPCSQTVYIEWGHEHTRTGN